MIGNTVNIFRSTDTGAPTLTGQAGSLITLLDACLIDGYNSKAIQSITRSGSTATVTFATTHGLNTDALQKVMIAGADQVEYNGVHAVSNLTSTSFDFTVSGTPVTPATGTMTFKVAPLGWNKAFSGTSKAVYKSAEATSTQLFLRIDDSNTKYAIARGYETMLDADTGSAPFPSAASQYWHKSSTADSVARAWELVGDGSIFYLFMAFANSYPNGHALHAFGDILSHKTADAYHCILFGQTSASATYADQYGNCGKLGVTHSLTGNSGSTIVARGYAQTGSAVDLNMTSEAMIAGGGYFGSTTTKGITYPDPVSGGLLVSPVFITESASITRGSLPGIYAPWHTKPGTRLTTLDIGGRKHLLMPLGISPGDSEGRATLDVTGPWR